MKVRFAGTVVLLLALAAPVQAQLAWDSPLLVPPNPAPGFGLFLIDPAGGSLGVLGTWRPSGTASRLQFRAGLAEEPRVFGGDLGVLGSVDVSGGLVAASDEFPMDVAWVGGAGVGIAEFVIVSFPFGLVAGRTFTDEGVAFTPYVSPRVVVQGTFDLPGDDGLDLGFAVDLGLDLSFANDWMIRFGGTFGDREALAIGVVF